MAERPVHLSLGTDPVLGDYTGEKQDIFEKDMVLDIASRVNVKLKDFGSVNGTTIDVFQTRYSDREMSNEQRAEMAKIGDADILVSIHTGHWVAAQPVPPSVPPVLIVLVLDNSGSMRLTASGTGKNGVPKKRRGDLLLEFLESFFDINRNPRKDIFNKNVYVGVVKFSTRKPTSNGVETIGFVNMAPDNAEAQVNFYRDRIKPAMTFDGQTTLLYSTIQQMLFRVPEGVGTEGRENQASHIDIILDQMKARGADKEIKNIRTNVVFVTDGVSDATPPYPAVSEISDKAKKSAPDNWVDWNEYQSLIRHYVDNENDDQEYPVAGRIENSVFVMLDAAENEDIDRITGIDTGRPEENSFFAESMFVDKMGKLEHLQKITDYIKDSIAKYTPPYGVEGFYKRYNENKELARYLVAQMTKSLYPNYTDDSELFYNTTVEGSEVEPESKPEEGPELADIRDALETHKSNFKCRGLTDVDDFYPNEIAVDEFQIEVLAEANLRIYGNPIEDSKVLPEIDNEFNTLSAEAEQLRSNASDPEVGAQITEKNKRLQELDEERRQILRRYTPAYDSPALAADPFIEETRKIRESLGNVNYRQHIALLDLVDALNKSGRKMHAMQLTVGYVHQHRFGERVDNDPTWKPAFEETKKLLTNDYKDRVADAIANGIRDFVKDKMKKLKHVTVCLDPGHGQTQPGPEEGAKPKVIAYYKIYRSEQEIYQDGSRGDESPYEYVGDSQRYSAIERIAAPRKFVDMSIDKNKVYRYRVQPVMVEEFAGRGEPEDSVGLLSSEYGIAVSRDVYDVDSLIDEIKGGKRDLVTVRPRIELVSFRQVLETQRYIAVRKEDSLPYEVVFRVVNMQIKSSANVEVLWFVSSLERGDLEIIGDRQFERASVERTSGRGEYKAQFELPFSEDEYSKLNFQIIAKGTALYSGDEMTLVYPDPKEI